MVYAVNDSKGRYQLWKDLVQLSKGTNFPWIVGGDFNSVLSTQERLQYRDNANEMIPFQNSVVDCDLEDIKFNGNFFTWNNKQEGKDRVYAKLDRFLANHKWMDKYTTAEVTFFLEGEFDHSPGLLSIYPNMQNSKKPSRYFNFWKNLEGFIDTVNKNWKVRTISNPMFCLVSHLKKLKSCLKVLNRQGKRNVEIQEHESYQHMIKIQQSLQQNPGNAETRVHKRIFQEGPMVTQRQADWLLQDYTKEEVKDALHSIPDDKALGPNGRLLKEINATIVTLIPKSVCPESMSDYRPIACCNVIYKIASKMICKRLEEVLTGIISENRCGFVKGKKIAHNIMICQDMVWGDMIEEVQSQLVCSRLTFKKLMICLLGIS
ncbi:uncharacterized protein LOC133802067 [Humulus lupulus]|uniref:uncharacterized protein LOC133802067 n=2 Tax=Humulus lupulus TaxID=3486 RepID=UPI002B40DCE2|nr:uncharacterized protein LOC133802067 [Humulus lupulus]